MRKLTRTQHVLLNVLTPLGIIYYSIRLWWEEYHQRALQQKRAWDPDLPEVVHKCTELRNIIARRT